MNEFLTPNGLAERLVQKTGISMEIAKNFSTVFFTIVRKGLKNQETFSVYNFGTFKKTWIEATVGLNPSTGEKIDIPAHWRIKFIPCAAVAKRINRPYAHLKAKELPDDAPDTLEEPQTSSVPIPVVHEDADEDAEREVDEPFDPDSDDDDDEDFTNEKHNLKLLVYAGIGLLFLILLVSLLVRSCTGRSKKAPEKTSTPQKTERPAPAPEPVKQPEPEPEPEVIAEEIAIDDEAEAIREASVLFESYTVPAGSDYHTIAGEKYGNRHLWPVIYAANKATKPDPDLIGAYYSIQIPALLGGEEGKQQIDDAIMAAYNGYLLMCEKQPESERNDERRRLAVRVLVSGEILHPGFIQAHKRRILPEYAAMAQGIADHQYGVIE